MRFIFSLACLYLSISTWGQIPEQHSFANMDTARIRQMIKQGNQISEQQSDSAKILFKQAYLLSRKILYKPGANLALTNLGHLYQRESRYDSARHYFFMAVVFLDTLKDSMALSKLFNWIGISYSSQVRLYPAITAYTKAVDFAANFPNERAAAYGNIGNVFTRLGNYEKALMYCNLALPPLIKSNDISGWSGVLVNKGNAFQNLGRTDSALYYLDSAFNMSQRHQFRREFTTAAVNLSHLCLETGQQLKAQEVLKQALLFLDSSNLYSREKNMLLVQAGRIHTALKQYDQAIHYLEQASNTVKEDTYNNMAILQALVGLYKKKQDYKQALESMESFTTIKDSLGHQEIVSKVNELEIRYRSAEKDKKLALQALSLTRQQKALSKRNTLIAVIISGVLLAGLLLIWRYRHLRRQQQHRNEVSHLKGIIEGEEKERYRLAHELHDGINAQLAAIQAHLTAGESSFPDHDPNIATARSLVKETAASIRRVAHNLAPHHLQAKGLVEMIQTHLRDLFADSATQTQVDTYGEFNSLDPELSLLLYRILQELTQNVKKYAEANRLTLLLYRSESQIAITAEDDGKGFDPATLTSPEASAGIGLAGIRDRLKRYNGKMEINSTPGEGTVVHIEVPDCR